MQSQLTGEVMRKLEWEAKESLRLKIEESAAELEKQAIEREKHELRVAKSLHQAREKHLKLHPPQE
jgi:hypothetical protein